MFTDSEPAPAPQYLSGERSSGPRIRRFLGPGAIEWRVHEAPLPAFDRRSGNCLIFQTAEIARRVRDYPANWFVLSDLELASLCAGGASTAGGAPLTRVCFFDIQDGASIRELPRDALSPEMVHAGRRYLRYRLSLLAAGREVLEAYVYCDSTPAAPDEHVIFRTLFPDRGGVFELSADE